MWGLGITRILLLLKCVEKEGIQLGDTGSNCGLIWAILHVLQFYLAFLTVIYCLRRGIVLFYQWEPLDADYDVIWRKSLELLLFTETFPLLPQLQLSFPTSRSHLTWVVMVVGFYSKSSFYKNFCSLHCLLTPQIALLPCELWGIYEIPPTFVELSQNWFPILELLWKQIEFFLGSLHCCISLSLSTIFQILFC